MPISLPPFGLPWAMLDRDARHTGHSKVVGPDDASVLGIPWPYATGGPITSSPVIDYAGTAYVGSMDAWLHAVGFNGRGAPLYQAGGPIQATPALIGEDVLLEEQAMVPSAIYFGSDDGRVYSILPNGTLRWVLTPGAQPNKSPIHSSPVVARLSSGLRRVYVGADSGHLYAVFETSTISATTTWEITTAAPLNTSPALSPSGERVYVGTSDGTLYCLDAFTGIPLANTPVKLGRGPLTSPAVDAAGNVYIADVTGTLFALDATGGNMWTVPLGRTASAPPTLGVAGEVLLIAGNRLHVFSAAGALLWSQDFPGYHLRATAPVVDSAGTTYVSSSEGWVFGVKRHPTVAGNRLSWSVQVNPAGPALTTPAIDANGRVYVGASDNRLYTIDEVPAFQLAFHSDLSASSNIDVYSLRESYGALDPARTLRLTNDPALDQQPAYSLDKSVMAYVSTRSGSQDVFLATAIVTDEENLTGPGSPFPPLSTETEPAFTPIHDLTGLPRPPHSKPYLALTTNQSGANRLVFVDLELQAKGTFAARSFSDWAASLGVDFAIRSQLEPPHTEQSQIAFAPDGKKMAWRHCLPTLKIGQVRLLALQGSSWLLTSIGPNYQYDPESTQPCGDEPCFSPDSRWLASREGLSLAIYDVVTNQKPVFSTPLSPVGNPTHPNWAPDGSEIAVGLNTGIAVNLFVASGNGYGTYTQLTTSRTSDEPYYHYFKMPPPQAQHLNPDRQVPGAAIEILGRGFDILHPENNKVFFTDTLRGPLHEAQVLSTTVNPYEGLGVLTVRVPALAGHGPITVETRFGSSTTPDFHVLPQPMRIVQKRSVPGAKVRIFGTGFDLSPATQNTVSFEAAIGGWVTTPILSSGLDGTEEFLIVQVPIGIAETGAIRVDNAFGGFPCSCTFTQLHPTFTIGRPVDNGPTTGLPAYALQGSTGVTVTLVGTDFPLDDFFQFGTTLANVDASTPLAPAAPPVTITTIHFAQNGPDTAKFGPVTFPFPGLGSTHPGGILSVRAFDANLPEASAVSPFRVPLTNIPIIFVPGTSGSSLDITPGTLLPDNFAIAPEVFVPWPLPATLGTAHRFDWMCKTCPPGSPYGPLIHPPFTFPLNPGLIDPRGQRVWMGPEAVQFFLALEGIPTQGSNMGNHYLDALAFNPGGTPTRPEIVPGTVFYDYNLVPLGVAPMGQYKPFIDFLTRSSPGWAARPLCNGLNPTTPTTGTEACLDVDPASPSFGATMSGRNAVYLFNLDWRDSISKEQGRLNAFVNAVLGRADVIAAGVKQVVLITHSYGGPVARGYYLNPANSAGLKVDQMISFGGGFLGVVDPPDILERGSTWGYGIGLGPLTGGLAEWETKALAQNWPTAYFQMPNSEDWFFDHFRIVNGKIVNRAYIRDFRSGGAGFISSYAGSMSWIASRHNAGLAAAQVAFFNPPPPAPPINMGDFRSGTGAIYHHRIIGKGRPDTVVATLVYLGPSEAGIHWFEYGIVIPNPIFPIPPFIPDPIRVPLELTPTERSLPVLGDGDSTIPYHGALGLTLPSDDRVYILDGIVHGDLTNVPAVLGAPGVKGLLQMLLEGSACSQPQAPAPFLSQNQVIEIL